MAAMPMQKLPGQVTGGRSIVSSRPRAPHADHAFISHCTQRFIRIVTGQDWPTGDRSGHSCRVTNNAAAALAAEPVAASSSTAIYSRPELYELAFSYRDIQQEVAFLQQVYARHASGERSLTSVIDLGCGPAAHAYGLAAAGVSQVIGVDMNADMLRYAQSKDTVQKVQQHRQQQQRRRQQPKQSEAPGVVTLVQGDMRNLKAVLGPEVRADMVTCLLGTLSHMLENQDALDVFRGVTSVLRPGGIFVVEVAHPGDLFDGTLIVGDGGKEMWEVAIPGSKEQPAGKLLVEWGSELDDFDPVTQVIDRTICLNRFQGDEVVQTVEEVVPARQFTAKEIELLAMLAGLKVKHLYGDMSTTVSLSLEDAYRMVAVLEKPLNFVSTDG